ncbi:hypothetical protein J6590_008504 [Homalodisca vitripennis]|nr:hypothetical protein J6590_008504 [Homalodisca vitripennis]
MYTSAITGLNLCSDLPVSFVNSCDILSSPTVQPRAGRGDPARKLQLPYLPGHLRSVIKPVQDGDNMSCCSVSNADKWEHYLYDKVATDNGYDMIWANHDRNRTELRHRPGHTQTCSNWVTVPAPHQPSRYTFL